MAKILILGGGFGGVIAAERLAAELGDEHQITLVSRSRNFVFYPALVRLAFGKCTSEEVSFDLRKTMLEQRINFIQAEVARIDPDERKVIVAHGDVEGRLPYDFLVFALGRRLATERVIGFYENAHHLLNVEKTLRFAIALGAFHKGRAIIGQCHDARLPVPVYETAFALSRLLTARGERAETRITIVSPEPPGFHLGDSEAAIALRNALGVHDIEFVTDLPINQVSPGVVLASDGRSMKFNLLMLLPPFQGSPVMSHLGLTNNEEYINVNALMRVPGTERIYAVGDCVNFSGPKMGHMAVRQAEVAAANLVSELAGREPDSEYVHEMKLVIDEGGSGSLYVHKDLWVGEPASVRQGRFWSWAKRVHEKTWEIRHS